MLHQYVVDLWPLPLKVIAQKSIFLNKRCVKITVPSIDLGCVQMGVQLVAGCVSHRQRTWTQLYEIIVFNILLQFLSHLSEKGILLDRYRVHKIKKIRRLKNMTTDEE